jgi:TatD DNase family protein
MAQPPRPAACSTASPKAWKSPSRAGYGLLHLVLGHLTFKNAQDLRDVAAFIPLDRMLIETDSPYLAPVPYRGKTNNPSYVPYVAQQVAQLRGISAEEVGRITSANFDRLFAGVVA